jgi:predicted dinucleotide-binding enzyme
MKTIKTIAIVGATGNKGSAIAKHIAATKKYRLLLMSPDEKKLAELKSSIENSATIDQVLTMNCAKEACWEADLIILATPQEAEKAVAERIREVATGKIVISIFNQWKTDFEDLVIMPDSSAICDLQRMLPHSKVLAAFATTLTSETLDLDQFLSYQPSMTRGHNET